MTKNDWHASIENGSHDRVRKFHSMDVSLSKSHLRYVRYGNNPTSYSIGKGILGVDIPNKGDVVSNS